jgi:CRISPR-associated protein Cmr1
MRPPPGVTPPDKIERKSDTERDIITQTRHYRLITPLFGGGVEPGRCDPVTVVRAGEIRGHLRFWWRATRGGQFSGNLARMKEAEDALWGAAGNEQGGGPSKVEVVVTEWTQGTPDIPFVVEGTVRNPKLRSRKGSNVPGYAAFPLQPRREDQQPGMEITPVWTGVTFTFSISFPCNNQSEIEAALWAWETFGGIGARTRRGFGALCCEKIEEAGKAIVLRLPDANPQQFQEWMQQEMQHHKITRLELQEIPWQHLHPQVKFKITRPSADALDRWRFLITRLRNFRSTQNHSWPEPDSVRRLVGQKTKGKQNTPVPSGANRFPRAGFGLPIIFHFKDGDPPDTTLQGVNHDRLASPLILRPLACADGQFVGLALILAGPAQPPGGLKLKDAPDDPGVVAELDAKEAARIDILQGKTDVLQAFLDTL